MERQKPHASLNGDTRANSLPRFSLVVVLLVALFCLGQVFLLINLAHGHDDDAVHANVTALLLQNQQLASTVHQLQELTNAQSGQVTELASQLQDVNRQFAKASAGGDQEGKAVQSLTQQLQMLTEKVTDSEVVERQKIGNLEKRVETLSQAAKADAESVKKLDDRILDLLSVIGGKEGGKAMGKAPSTATTTEPPEGYRPSTSSRTTSRPLPARAAPPRFVPGNDFDNEAAYEFPDAWLKTRSREELLASAKEARRWQTMAREAFKHTWRGYKQTAWGEDELKPVKGGGGRAWAKCGLSMLDALSTAWLMGLMEEFDEAERWITESLRFDQDLTVSFFEMTIRAIGGLASAHSLSGREIFLTKAKDLADRMIPAFKRPGWPDPQINLKTGKPDLGWYDGTILSEVGSIQLEWRYLSQYTGDPIYAAKADKSMYAVLDAADGKGLVPWGLSKRGGPAFVQNQHISFGAMGDSYYEYLLKLYLQTGRTEDIWKDEWKKSMKEMQAKVVKRTKAGLTFVTELEADVSNDKMDHLACFVPGMLMLGHHALPETEVDGSWVQLAEEITETCYQMYVRQPSGLAPEIVEMRPFARRGIDMGVWEEANHCLLRPETAEAIFYMFYFTGDPKYRRMAGHIMEALENKTKTVYGYSAVDDVRLPQPVVKDEMESFFLAETLKYLYLTFVPNPRDVIDLDEFVLNTEAHPLRIHHLTAEELSKLERPPSEAIEKSPVAPTHGPAEVVMRCSSKNEIVPDGWRLATSHEALAFPNAAQAAVDIAGAWAIVALADGKIDGSGYGYSVHLTERSEPLDQKLLIEAISVDGKLETPATTRSLSPADVFAQQVLGGALARTVGSDAATKASLNDTVGSDAATKASLNDIPAHLLKAAADAASLNAD